MALLPPWDERISLQNTWRISSPAGYHSITSPPHASNPDHRVSIVIAWDRLLLQWLALGGMTVALAMVHRSFGPAFSWSRNVLYRLGGQKTLIIAVFALSPIVLGLWIHTSVSYWRASSARALTTVGDDSLTMSELFREWAHRPPILRVGDYKLHPRKRWIISPSTPKIVQAVVIPGALVLVGLVGLGLTFRRCRRCWRTPRLDGGDTATPSLETAESRSHALPGVLS